MTDAGLLVIWAFGAWQVYSPAPADQRLTVGVLIAFVAYIGRFYGRLESMSRMVAAMQRAGGQRAADLRDPRPRAQRRRAGASGAIPAGCAAKSSSAASASATAAGRCSTDVDLNDPPRRDDRPGGAQRGGQDHAGQPGLPLLRRDRGAILVDGTDIRSFPVDEYRRHIGIVLQEPFLFYGTIAENIAYGRPDAAREEIIAAARAARAHEFILRLPDGYDSLVGERGQSLSGGERQRISIARALLIDPRILILDEATSSVDTETEREIQLALENLIRGRTTIAIAHRLSTLRRADRLVVIERGRITEIGRHDELLETRAAPTPASTGQVDMSTGQAVEKIEGNQ